MNWDSYLRTLYRHPVLDLSLDLSGMGMDPAWLLRMMPAMESALAEMRQLESGAIANPDEGRMVGHYWLRDAGRAPTLELASQIRGTLARVREFAQQVADGRCTGPGGQRFTDLLVIGIGGSALGPQFLADALVSEWPMAAHFLDNTDPDGIGRVLDRLDAPLSRVLVLVISKSGTTPETRNGMLLTQARMKARGLEFAGQAVAITCPGSALDQQASQEGWLDRFPMFDWVGGRTSLFSAVGLLPAALQGIDIDQLLDGASLMDEATRQGEIAANPAALLALAWHHAGEGHGRRNMVVLPYRDRLQLFSRYLQQLVMESLGKDRDRQGRLVNQGITVFGNKGSTDQHAYVQQLRDGPEDFFVTFIQVLEDARADTLEVESGIRVGDYLYGFLRGTRRALLERGRRSLVLTLPRLDPLLLGALVALYERAVGLYASLLDINAYNQPGVEAGKRAAADLLDLQKRLLDLLAEHGTPMDLQALAAALGARGEEDEVYNLLRHLAAGGRLVLDESDPSRPVASRP